MNSTPNPALVTQEAARTLPRWALLLLCLAYVVPGFIGREPWKNADVASLGVMLALLDGSWSDWLRPASIEMIADRPAPLAYWLGALAMRLAPPGIAPELAVRLPFALMLAATLAATWYAVYQLARRPSAQPVAFAFGGEAEPRDYARALADGGLLALMATLGLAQLSHETTPALTQLFFSALVFLALAAGTRPLRAAIVLLVGVCGLALAGAPSLATYCAALGLVFTRMSSSGRAPGESPSGTERLAFGLRLAALAACVALAFAFDLWRWPEAASLDDAASWRALARMYLWFTWPVWPFVLWTFWRWRRQLSAPRRHPHLGLPVALAAAPVLGSIVTSAGDRALLLALPPLAALAAFALPTFRRSASALIDWFTVLFFTGWAVVIWVVWISMETGVPAKPAANVARLAPDFEPVFQWPAFLAALAGTLAWIALARWRTGRHRTALWKSMVLPAAGATLCWLLLMTLWLPALDYARSFAAQMRSVRAIVGDTPCVQVHGLSSAQVGAVRHHAGWTPVPARGVASCPWMLVDVGAEQSLSAVVDLHLWRAAGRVPRPTDANDTLLLFRRIAPD